MIDIINSQGGIFIVVYADVLFIVNFFITLLLLEITAKAGKRSVKTFRIVVSASLGGVYSLIILVESIPVYIVFISKIFAAVILILVSFGLMRIKSFASMLLIFLFSNYVFLGIITGMQMLVHSNMIRINNGEVYFDINARQLILTALIAYCVSCFIIRLYNKKLSAGEIYNVRIKNKGKEAFVYALSDSGNKLREPFSDYPVIVVDKKLLNGLYDGDKLRLIPTSTVNKNSFLQAFKPETVEVKTAKGWIQVSDVYVALSDDMNSKSFSAVINPEIISV